MKTVCARARELNAFLHSHGISVRHEGMLYKADDEDVAEGPALRGHAGAHGEVHSLEELPVGAARDSHVAV